MSFKKKQMRFFAIFLPFLIIAGGCADDQRAPVSTVNGQAMEAPKEGGRPQDFGKRYAEAWSSQDPAQVAEFFATDGSLSVNDGDPAIGRQAIAKVADGFMKAFPDMIVTMDRLVTKEDGIEFHWTLTGTNTGPRGTGNAIRISGSESWLRNEEGLIQRSMGSYDAKEFERQVREGRRVWNLVR